MIANKLIKLSDYLDSIGLHSHANYLDKLIVVASGIDYENEKVPDEAVIESLYTPEIEALLDLANEKPSEEDYFVGDSKRKDFPSGDYIDYENEKVPDEIVLESYNTPEMEALFDLAEKNPSEFEEDTEEESFFRGFYRL